MKLNVKELNEFFREDKEKNENIVKNKELAIKRIRNLIRFKNETVVHEYNISMENKVSKLSSLKIIHNPIDIQYLTKALEEEYFVLFDPESKNFYEVKFYYNYVLYEYIVLLPKIKGKSLYVITVIRELDDEIQYSKLLTGIFCESVRHFCIKEVNKYSDLLYYEPDSGEFPPEKVVCDDIFTNRYVKEEFLKTKVKISRGKSSTSHQIFTRDSTTRMEAFSESIVNETYKLLKDKDIGDTYSNELDIVGNTCIRIKGENVLQNVDCNVKNVLNDRLIGLVPIEVRTTIVDITYIFENNDKREEKYVIRRNGVQKEGIISDFIS